MTHRPGLYRPRRLPLPMSSGVIIPPGSSCALTARPQTSKFYPERLLIKEASHWKIDAIRVEDRAGDLVRDLPGTTFAPDAPGRFPGCGEIEIRPGGQLTVVTTYTGPREAGLPFEACVFGTDDQAPRVTSTWGKEEKIATARGTCAIPPNTTVRLSTHPMKYDAWPSRLVIQDASDWIVNDVYVGEVSIFAQSGDVPGSMFSEEVRSMVCLGHLAPGDALSVVATYVGVRPRAEFAYELYGTLDESEAGDLPIAAILPMSSGVNILPSASAQLTSRCRSPDHRSRGIGPRQGFLAEQIVLGDPANWTLSDVKIGRASQFAQSGDVPGLAFGPGTLGSAVSFDVAPADIDVIIVATHVGPREAGDAFVCGILGSIVDLTEIDPAPRHSRTLSIHDLR